MFERKLALRCVIFAPEMFVFNIPESKMCSD